MGSGAGSVGGAGGVGGAGSSPRVPDRGQLENRFEAALVCSVVLSLLRAGGLGGDIGVISPYRSQLRLLRRVLSAGAGAGALGEAQAVEVDTVDRFQGRDKRVIVMSLVRSNARGEVGQVLGDVRRLNVAVSRAKHKLVVVGSGSTLAAGSAEHFGALLGLLRERGWVEALALGSARDAGVPRVPGVGRSVWEALAPVAWS